MTALLPTGARVALVAPAHAFDPHRLDQGVSWLHGRGYRTLELGPRTPERHFAAPREARRDALVEALTRPDVDAVWAIRGGSGVTDLLPRLPWDRLDGRPLLGFSDLTPLLDAHARRGGVALHAPVVHSLPRTDTASREHLVALLEGRPVPPLDGVALTPGTAEGPLVGGNLCLLAATCGTPFQLDARGAILVLEEIGEAPYRIERMLVQLGQAGVLDDLAGVALGTFTGCHAPDEAPGRNGLSPTLAAIVATHLGGLGIPVVAGLPIGHGPENRAFRVRAPGRLSGGRLHLAPPSDA
jgi:muramoyltetrapeptide carboxypeptidase